MRMAQCIARCGPPRVVIDGAAAATICGPRLPAAPAWREASAARWVPAHSARGVAHERVQVARDVWFTRVRCQLLRPR